MIRCVIIRGGTSRGVYFHENELPNDPELRDKVILDVFGSPDVREIDGLGGADLLTSKVCIIGPSNRKDADVDYTFGQVLFDKPIVSYAINCGNLSSGVGPFAVDEGLVKPVEPITTVRIYNTNTKKILVAEVPVKNGKAVVAGDYQIDGVPGTGAKIVLDFAATAGTINGKLLPTGKAKEKLFVDDELGEINVSIVDAANPTVFCYAEDIGINGQENFKELLADSEIWRKAELVRGAAAELLGLVKNRKNSATENPLAPFSVFITKASRYKSYVTGESIDPGDIDFRGVLWAAGVSKAFAVTGTICTGAAAMIEGTIVNEFLSEKSEMAKLVKIGHPSGVIEIQVEVEKEAENLLLKKAKVFRTARRIMEGYVYLKPGTLEK